MSIATPSVTPVLVRAFGMEPLERKAVAQNEEITTLFSANPDRVGVFRNEDVFAFDSQLSRDLRKAFADGNEDALVRLWSSASPFCGR